MTTIRIPRTPSFRLHKPSGQGFIEIDGRRHYLGKYELPETQRAYHTLIAEWTTNGYRLSVAPDEITMIELTDAYLEFSRVYYRDTLEQPSSTHAENRATVKKLLTLYQDTPASSFGPNSLRNVQQLWINDGLSISTINTRIGIIKRMFKWAVSNEMLCVTVYQSLTTLSGLRRGRGMGKDPVTRQTIPLEDIEKTLALLPAPLAAAARLQLFTGARPSEILHLKRGDIDCKGDIWTALIRNHKTSHLGKQRRIFFGPRAQSVLRPFLLRSDKAYLFSPKESVAQRPNDGKARRRPNQAPNPRKTDRTLSDYYDAHAYRRAVARACNAAGIDTWSPYRLRHTAATLIEASSDMETAKAILGHSSINITQVYVHRDNKTAAAWAAIHG